MPPGLRWPGYSRPRSTFGVKRRRQSGGTGGAPTANAAPAQAGPVRPPPPTDRQPEPSARIRLRHGVTRRTLITLCRDRVSLAPFTGYAAGRASRRPSRTEFDADQPLGATGHNCCPQPLSSISTARAANANTMTMIAGGISPGRLNRCRGTASSSHRPGHAPNAHTPRSGNAHAPAPLRRRPRLTAYPATITTGSRPPSNGAAA
jgi:hypothetical protein